MRYARNAPAIKLAALGISWWAKLVGRVTFRECAAFASSLMSNSIHTNMIMQNTRTTVRRVWKTMKHSGLLASRANTATTARKTLEPAKLSFVVWRSFSRSCCIRICAFSRHFSIFNFEVCCYPCCWTKLINFLGFCITRKLYNLPRCHCFAA